MYQNIIFFFQAEDGIRDLTVTGVQTCALPIYRRRSQPARLPERLRSRARALAPERASVCVADRRPRPLQARQRQIGRASCRERVYMTAVTESIITKSKHEYHDVVL